MNRQEEKKDNEANSTNSHVLWSMDKRKDQIWWRKGGNGQEKVRKIDENSDEVTKGTIITSPVI